jgi:hypothetical protein
VPLIAVIPNRIVMLAYVCNFLPFCGVSGVDARAWLAAHAFWLDRMIAPSPDLPQ